jgi:hypothetical protein
MSYSVVKKDNSFNIFEKESETEIVLERSEKEARDICRKLNLGSGFHGFTPHFFAHNKGVITI